MLLVNAANGTLNGSDLVVRGTFASMSKLYDETGLRIPLATAQRLLRVKGAHQWLVLLDDTEVDRRVAASAFEVCCPRDALR